MFYSIESIAPICRELLEHGKKIVLATGFFDLLHVEHINFLKKAKNAGEILVVAVESDKRAKDLKGDGRPVESQSVRCKKVSNFSDYVIALPDNFNSFDAYDSLMASVKPNIYAVSSHTTHIKSKTFLVEKYGGHIVVVHDFNPEVSTTQLIQQNQV